MLEQCPFERGCLSHAWLTEICRFAAWKVRLWHLDSLQKVLKQIIAKAFCLCGGRGHSGDNQKTFWIAEPALQCVLTVTPGNAFHHHCQAAVIDFVESCGTMLSQDPMDNVDKKYTQELPEAPVTPGLLAAKGVVRCPLDMDLTHPSSCCSFSVSPKRSVLCTLPVSSCLGHRTTGPKEENSGTERSHSSRRRCPDPLGASWSSLLRWLDSRGLWGLATWRGCSNHPPLRAMSVKRPKLRRRLWARLLRHTSKTAAWVQRHSVPQTGRLSMVAN